MTAVAIRYVHAGDLSTEAALALTWNVGVTGERFQEIAIVGDRVVGSWSYCIEVTRGRYRIDSGSTDVQPRYRRKGIARALWFAGIARWSPTRIESTVGSDEGRDFLARMTAEVAYRAPELLLWVKPRTEDMNCWEDRCSYEARELLKRLSRRDSAKALATQPLMKLIKAGAS